MEFLQLEEMFKLLNISFKIKTKIGKPENKKNLAQIHT